MIELVNQKMVNNIIKFYELTKSYDTPAANSITEVNYFNETRCTIEDSLEVWAENKHDIFQLFGNKLKIELPLKNISLPEQVASECQERFLKEHGSKFNPLILSLLTSLYPEEIVNNTLSKDFNIMDVQLKAGWKITKCFKSLEIYEEKVSQQQDLYSRFIQSLKINGTLVLSIDPIDYITMSCSQSNWASCHHPNRDYGTGSMFYMCDNSTVIAYVKSKNDCKFFAKDGDITTEISFPNKIWRQLVIFSPKLQYAIQMRQYPNSHSIINDNLGNLIKDLLHKSSSKDMYSVLEQVEDNETLHDLAMSNSDYNNRYYSDIYYESFETATVIMDKDINNIDELYNIACKNRDVISIGEEAYCACGCGSRIVNNHFFTCEHEADEDECDD